MPHGGPDAENKSCAQIAQARTILQRMAAIQQELPQPALPLLMGDFNAAAYSAVYSFVAQGVLDCSAHDRRDLSGQLAGLTHGRVHGPAQVLAPACIKLQSEAGPVRAGSEAHACDCTHFGMETHACMLCCASHQTAR